MSNEQVLAVIFGIAVGVVLLFGALIGSIFLYFVKC